MDILNEIIIFILGCITGIVGKPLLGMLRFSSRSNKVNQSRSKVNQSGVKVNQSGAKAGGHMSGGDIVISGDVVSGDKTGN